MNFLYGQFALVQVVVHFIKIDNFVLNKLLHLRNLNAVTVMSYGIKSHTEID